MPRKTNPPLPLVAGDSEQGEQNDRLRQIPSMEKLLSSAEMGRVIEEFGRSLVKEHLASELSKVRSPNASSSDLTLAALITNIRPALMALTEGSLRPVINGTGVMIHTNLGRAPVGNGSWERGGRLVTAYSNLEFDLESGERGSREGHLSELAARLFGCEAALLTNNNAAAMLLLVSALARGKELIVSRGELVEIGGSFRVPEVIEQGGARLREVGTTNRTRPDDYLSAVSRRTAALLRVNQSNFEIVGFTESPSTDEMISVARRVKRPLLWDEGSGRVVDLSPYGFRKGTTVRELIAAGVDAVTCSTDKLLGATQGGLILGRKEIIEQCRKHPLMRALRGGKESYAVISQVLLAFLSSRHEELIPLYQMLAAPLDSLRERADRFHGEMVSTTPIESVLGGGTTPAETMPSWAITIAGDPDSLASRLRMAETPVVGRIANGVFAIDMRTVFPHQDSTVAQILAQIVGK